MNSIYRKRRTDTGTHLREIKEIVKETFRKFNLGEESQKLFTIWQEELGGLAKHAQIGNFREGKLLVEVDNTVYMQELSAKRKSIMERVNKKMGKRSIVEIRFRLGRMDRSKSED
ncbi:MAG: DUF721 domain-containing protein [bacterium]